MSVLVRFACLLRAVGIALFYPAWLAFLSTLVLISSLLPKSYAKPTQDAIVSLWAESTLLWFGLDVEISGEENLPRGEGVLFLTNHMSHLDIPVVHYVIPSPRFGAKIELFKIPIFGRAMRAAGALPIARGQREKVFQVYKEAEHRFAQGESFILAPEGTRQSGEKLGSFRSGPFVFAINAKVRIVPIVLEGVDRALPKNSLFPNLDRWRRRVQVRILPPVETAPYQLKERPLLQEKVFDLMNAAFEELREKSRADGELG